MIRNVIFDWSGTLVDDLPPVLETTNRILEEFGAPPLARDEFRRRFKLPFEDFYAEVLPGVAMEVLELRYLEYFPQARSQVTMLPHAREFLDFCQGRGMRLFVLSAIHGDHWEEQSENLGVKHYFEQAHVAVRDKRREIARILEQSALARSETMLAGDMQHDIETAKAAGIFSVATLTGYDPPDQLAVAAPDLMVQNLSVLQRSLAQGASLAKGGGAWEGADEIHLRGLRVATRIGVPEQERSEPQELVLDVTLLARARFSELADEVEKTTDYDAVARRIREFCGQREGCLIETLAEDLASLLLAEYAISAVELEVRKFILPDCDHVAVRIRRGDARTS
ncbi:MAG: dihydroneopterin aldolase [Verrucomicrobiales bacterium]